jgi:hypothetical protein
MVVDELVRPPPPAPPVVTKAVGNKEDDDGGIDKPGIPVKLLTLKGEGFGGMLGKHISALLSSRRGPQSSLKSSSVTEESSPPSYPLPPPAGNEPSRATRTLCFVMDLIRLSSSCCTGSVFTTLTTGDLLLGRFSPEARFLARYSRK